MTARSFTALVNPISGERAARAMWEPVAELLAAAGATVTTETTASSADAVERATAAADRGDVVVAVGGDGLVRDAAGGAVRGGGTLAVVPAGRGNDLARLLGVPTAAPELARMLLEGPADPIDVLDVNGVIVPGNAYFGVESAANRVINRLRFLPALLVYRISAPIALLTWRNPTVALDADGTRRTVRATSVVIANSGSYGHGLRIVPPARLDDGRLDVMVVEEGIPKREIVAFTNEAREGRHIERPQVRLSTATTLTVSADRPIPLCADGDEIGTLPATVRVLPGALPLITPRR
ncbi:diacylglycerol/lipid kinase family protein [Actinomadura atramentaria]|uniref:diacylglycerol/lipid kinase family protein n=1 Tax=Actinomadura atramentaria TaxID=1990 RepID=UPI00037CB602|nr:diacylglycerol kinase family protein [Actinomadura atramentaria]